MCSSSEVHLMPDEATKVLPGKLQHGLAAQSTVISPILQPSMQHYDWKCALMLQLLSRQDPDFAIITSYNHLETSVGQKHQVAFPCLAVASFSYSCSSPTVDPSARAGACRPTVSLPQIPYTCQTALCVALEPQP